MAFHVIEVADQLRPNATILLVAVAIDLAVGDPVYRWHPVRLIGRVLAWLEAQLCRMGLDGYGGGILLFLLLTAVSMSALAAAHALTASASPYAAWIVQMFLVYSLLAVGDLLHHVWRIERAVRADDLAGARTAVSALVGRDTDRMDAGGCRRAAVESLSENLTDGFVSPIFWYALLGLPGLVLFKVVSTMDSMVGYKTPRYLRFGWCGARLDDAMNYLPARITWLLIAVVSLAIPGCSWRKTWRVGLSQHALLLGPNSGWSEAATAGALQRRIVGPIWLKGVQVTDLWIGDLSDPPLETASDVARGMILVTATGVVAALCTAIILTAR